MGTTGTRRTGRALAFAVGAAAVALPFIGFSPAPSASAVPTTPTPITGDVTLPSFPATTQLTISQIPDGYRDYLTKITLTATVEGEVDGELTNLSETQEKAYTTSIDVGITVKDEGIIDNLVAEASASDALTIPDGGSQSYLLSADDATSETIAGDDLDDAVLDLLVGDGDVTFDIDSFVETTVGGPAPWLSTGIAEGVATIEMEYTYDIPELAECPQGTYRIDLPGDGDADEGTHAIGDSGYALTLENFATTGDMVSHDWSSPDVGINRILALYGAAGEHDVDVVIDPPKFEGTLESSGTSGSGALLDLQQLCVGITPPVVCEDFEKIEPVEEGTYLDGRFTITEVHDTPLGPTFDWTSTVDVHEIYVKGGPDKPGKLYTYDPPQQSDTDGLHAPHNANSGKYYGLSNIRVCLDDAPPEVCPYDPDLDIDDPNCDPPTSEPCVDIVKFEFPDNLTPGTYPSEGGAREFEITAVHDDGSFDWATDYPVDWMAVKGGSVKNGGGYFEFPDLGGATSGTAHAPENPNTDEDDYFGLSHLKLCVGDPVEVCEWDPNLPPDHDDCQPPPEECPYDPELDIDDPNCDPPTSDPCVDIVKFEFPDRLTKRTYSSEDGTRDIEITAVHDDGSFDWATDYPVDWMAVKGGSVNNGGGYFEFPDLGGATSGTAHAPENTRSGSYFGLSHLKLCVGDPVDECPEAGVQTNPSGGDDCPPDCPEEGLTTQGGGHHDDDCPPVDECPELDASTNGGSGGQDCPPDEPPPPPTTNDDCKGQLDDFKIDPVREGDYPLPGGGTFTITRVTKDGKYFAWTSTVPIEVVWVKGGSGPLALWSPENPTSGTSYHALINESNGKPYGLSHLCVFPEGWDSDQGGQEVQKGEGDQGRKDRPAAPQSDDPEHPKSDDPEPNREKPKPTEPVKPKPEPQPEPAPETKKPAPDPNPEKKAEPPEKESTPPAPSKASSDDDEEEEAA